MNAIVQGPEHGPISRSETRTKAIPRQRLEIRGDTILPFLKTPEGVRVIQAVYISLLRHNKAAKPEPTSPVARR
jgi:hypothetical protein